MHKDQRIDERDTLIWKSISAPLGSLHLGANASGICSVAWALPNHASSLNSARDGERAARAILELASCELAEYFAGKRKKFSVPVVLQGTTFQSEVWRALRAIPYGQTVTYRELGRMIGMGKAARAVGNANARNPVPVLIPCHRVVREGGELGGYAGGAAWKRGLLAVEGLAV